MRTIFARGWVLLTSLALVLTLSVGGSAQTGEPDSIQEDGQKPTLETYEPDSLKLPQGLERIEVYGQPEEGKPVLETYDSKPAPPASDLGPQPPPAPSNWEVDEVPEESEEVEDDDESLDGTSP